MEKEVIVVNGQEKEEAFDVNGHKQAVVENGQQTSSYCIWTHAS